MTKNFKMGFETKNCHFYVLFIWTATIAILHQKFEIVTADNKNAIETPFLAVLSPQKVMRGIPIGFWEKSNFLAHHR